MNEEMKKYYDILGVSDEATDQEVYKAYRGKDVIISQEVVNNWRSQKRVGITKRSYTYLHLENEEGEAYCHGCGKVDSLPSKRYLNLKYLPPCGVTRRKRPLPSNNFFFLFDGLDVRIFMSLSAIKDFLHFWGYLFSRWGIFNENVPPNTPDFDKPYSTSLDKWQEKTRYF